MKYALLSIFLLLSSFVAIAFQETSPGDSSRQAEKQLKKPAFEQDVEKYLSQKNHKAYAMAFGDKSGWVSGYGYHFGSQKQADERALLECEKGH